MTVETRDGEPAIQVLMIEDEEAVARLIGGSLGKQREMRFEWRQAPSLAEGIGAIHREPPDVILLDLGLPDSQGMETLGRVHEVAPTIPIIVLTGMYDEEMALQAIEQGASEFFCKPDADHDSLRRAIRYALERARNRREILESEARLRSLSHRLVEVQEEERRRIARELHDEVGQVLTALEVQLGIVVREKNLGDTLEESRALVGELLGRIRNLSLDLRPAMLDDLGLLPALLWLIERYTLKTGVEVTLKHVGLEQRLGAEVETAAFRIVQEALTNVARHARVTEVEVRLVREDAHLRFEIHDLGAGFEVAAVRASAVSSGLSGMEERATLLGGTLSIGSSPGGGTSVFASLPLDRRRNRANGG